MKKFAYLFLILMPLSAAAEWDAYSDEFAKEMAVVSVIAASSLKGVVQETPSLAYAAGLFYKYKTSERAVGRVSMNIFNDYEYSEMKAVLLNYLNRLAKSEDVPLEERIFVLKRLYYAYGIPAGFPIDLSIEWLRLISVPE